LCISVMPILPLWVIDSRAPQKRKIWAIGDQPTWKNASTGFVAS
jgi:hypothetical protein